MILSRTMREQDYHDLVPEGELINEVHRGIEMWYEPQHTHRLWEYALAQKALKEVFGDSKNLKTADHGCGAGYMSPILFWLGHHVQMYECWSFSNGKNEEKFMLEQMRKVGELRAHLGGSYEMHNRPLGQLVEADRWVDAAFCISTLEHIRDYQTAFRDLLSTVKVGGLVFLTTDFAESEVDNYFCSSLRAGKMFTGKTYDELFLIAQGMGFCLVGGLADWRWSEENRLVFNYGFASMALVRER